VAHKGVSVGSAHPAWIDTDMVRDTKADLKTFADALDRMPWPLNSTTSLEDCADAMVEGILRRRSRVYVPRTMAGVQALRTVFTGPIAGWVIRREAKTMVPQMEAEITKLGRWFGSSSAATPAERKAIEEPAAPKLPT
jgi:short-subunit dehydrogenase